MSVSVKVVRTPVMEVLGIRRAAEDIALTLARAHSGCLRVWKS
jgi:hypothetical protein